MTQRRSFRHISSRVLIAVALAVCAPTAAVLEGQGARTLDIYWIDVEGGAATLVVTPQGQSVLMDAGFAGFNDRDAARIEAVVTGEAKLRRLDYVLLSHFHADHAGGLDALAKRVTIGAFIDHGELVEDSPVLRTLWTRYRALAGDRRHTAVAGERLPLTGVDFTIVASGRQFVRAAPSPAAAPNAQCESFQRHPDDLSENSASLGYLLRAGRFEFVNLGDLSWNGQHALACPINLLGAIDLFQVPHHGVRDDVLPQLMWAMGPRVAVMNNGPTKGAGPVAIDAVLHSPGLEDLWSLHRAVGNDAAHNAREPVTANLGESKGCAGHWLRARVNANGTYTLTNSRNGYSKTYRVQ